MERVLLPLLATVGLAAYVLHQGCDDITQRHPSVRWTLGAALLPLAALAAFTSLMGLGEMVGDGVGGGFHLMPILAIAVLGWLAWQRPVAGGVTLLLLGALLGATCFTFVNGEPRFEVQAALIAGAPFALAGFGLLSAYAVARRTPSGQHGCADPMATIPRRAQDGYDHE